MLRQRFAICLCAVLTIATVSHGLAGEPASSVRFEAGNGDMLALNGSTVKDARMTRGAKGKWQIWLRLKTEAAKRFEAMTRDNLGKPLRVVHNGRVVQRAVIQAAISAKSSAHGLIVLADQDSAKSMLDALKR